MTASRIRNASQSPRAAFLQLAEAGQLGFQRGGTGEDAVFPPRLGPREEQPLPELLKAETKGTVFSYTEIERKGERTVLALIDLDEGCRLLARVDVPPCVSVRIGARVALKARASADMPFLTFAPSEDVG